VYAVVKTGGKQYQVRVGETIDVEKLAVEDGADVRLDQVLLASNDGDVVLGRPLIDGAVVTARAVRQHKGPKLIVFRYKSKSRYRRRTGHRQQLTQLAIQSIEVPGWEVVRVAPAPTPAASTAVEEPVAPTAGALMEETVAPASNATPVAPSLAADEAAEPMASATVEEPAAPAAEEPGLASTDQASVEAATESEDEAGA
jgi:large subunit ribosomal protein L21